MKKSVCIAALVVSLLVGAVAQAEGPRRPAEGSEGGTGVGNGGGGYGGELRAPRYDRRPVPQWCSAVQGWIGDAISMASQLDSAAAQRAYLSESVGSFLNAYDNGTVAFAPVTYSVLDLAKRMDGVFPTCRKGCDPSSLSDRTAALILSSLLVLAREQNSKFDMANYVPDYYPHHRDWSRCGDDCSNPSLRAFRVEYLGSVRDLLGVLFQPAYADAKGTLLDAMANDVWELKAHHLILSTVLAGIRSDVFNRDFACVEARLGRVQETLVNHLSGGGSLRDNTRMVRYVRDSLAEALNELAASGLEESNKYDGSSHYVCR